MSDWFLDNPAIGGLRLFESVHALETTDVPVRVHNRRRHRESYHRRIQKKWIKRWGYVRKPAIWKTPLGLFVHPALMSEVRAALSKSAALPWEVQNK